MQADTKVAIQPNMKNLSAGDLEKQADAVSIAARKDSPDKDGDGKPDKGNAQVFSAQAREHFAGAETEQTPGD